MKTDRLNNLVDMMTNYMETTGANCSTVAIMNDQTNKAGFVLLIAEGEVAHDFLEAIQAVSTRLEIGGTVQ